MESAGTIVQRVTGEPLNAKYFVDYLWQKYGDIFNIQR
jgi:Zn-dependent M32 family carboxypeptidase